MARAFLFLILGSFIIAAVLSPPIMSLIYWIHPETRWPFSRVYGRVAQIVAAVIIIVMRKNFNLSELKSKFREKSWAGKTTHLLLGLLITSVSIAIVIPLLVKGGILVYTGPAAEDFGRIILEVLVAMLFVSILEESFFRVLVFSSLKKSLNKYLAAVLSSVLYAFVHFIAPVKGFKYTGFDPLIGFKYLSEVGARFAEPEVYPAIFGLFLVGMILCFVIENTKSLFLCIGLHMGWAAGLKIIKFISVFPGGTEIPNDLGGRYFLVAQPEAWLSMLFVFVAVFLLSKPFKISA